MSYPLSVQTAYQDLLEAHRLRAISDIPGAPILKDQGIHGKYWYARQRIGDRVVDRYIGKDSEDLRQRIEAVRNQGEARREFEQRCATIVAQLRAAGLPTLDRNTGKVVSAMARVGAFRLGGTLVGTHAFRLYAAELGVGLPQGAAVTQDVDIAAFENLKLAIDDHTDPTLAETFRDLRLMPAPGMDPKNRSTRWVMQDGGTIVDFLAPKMQEKSETVLLEPLGVHAQALPFLNFLIADPIAAVGLYRSGILVQIPKPERYAIHKLIVAQRRSAGFEAKARKDLAQAGHLIRILADDRPYELEAAYRKAISTGPKWREAIDRSFRQRPELGEILNAL